MYLYGVRVDLFVVVEDYFWSVLILLFVDLGSVYDVVVFILFGVFDYVLVLMVEVVVVCDFDVLFQCRVFILFLYFGQVLFFGGCVELEDVDFVVIVFCEVEEEMGFDFVGVEVFVILFVILFVVSNYFVIFVFVWWQLLLCVVVVDYVEIVEVFCVLVVQLLDFVICFILILIWMGCMFCGLVFDVDGIIVWGFIVMVFDVFFDVVGWIVLWDVMIEWLIEF